eukprot:7140771-Pyramimonas_sp.AAC.1
MLPRGLSGAFRVYLRIPLRRAHERLPRSAACRGHSSVEAGRVLAAISCFLRAPPAEDVRALAAISCLLR